MRYVSSDCFFFFFLIILTKFPLILDSLNLAAYSETFKHIRFEEFLLLKMEMADGITFPTHYDIHSRTVNSTLNTKSNVHPVYNNETFTMDTRWKGKVWSPREFPSIASGVSRWENPFYPSISKLFFVAHRSPFPISPGSRAV